jgi:hypothetical protein
MELCEIMKESKCQGLWGRNYEKVKCFEWHKWFKESSHVEITTEDNAHYFVTNGTVHFEFIPQGQTVNQAYYVELLYSYEKLYTEKDLNFGPMTGFSTMTLLHLTRHYQKVPGPKINY